MIIQHNMSAMNAGRNLRKNNDSLKKNLEKLSSGYRINRSADDAAGLAISESMRASIACLEQAENNATDGISLVQTADGAMQEIHGMLDRMLGLAAQAANGTLTDKERDHIQDEIDQLLSEINRIKDDTKFNGIPLLQGDDGASYVKPTILGGLPAWVDITQGGTLGDTHTTTESYTSATGTPGDVNVDHVAAKLDFNTGFNKDDLLGENVGFHSTCCTCSRHYSITFTDETTNSVETSGTHSIYKIGIKDVTNADKLVDAILNGVGLNPDNHFTFFEKDGAGKLVIYDGRPKDTNFLNSIPSDADFPAWKYEGSGATVPHKDMGYGLFAPGVAYDSQTVTVGDIAFQIGENETSRMDIDLPNMNSTLIGITGLSVRTDASASAAISTLKNGVAYVSAERARMGAYQNRLEHTYKNLGNTVENLTQSESKIRDVDMAEEMMAYTKNNILAQSAQAMLAQSNQVPQGVLQLMQ